MNLQLLGLFSVVFSFYSEYSRPINNFSNQPNRNLDCYKILDDMSVNSLYDIQVGVPTIVPLVYDFKPLEGTKIDGLCYEYIHEENAVAIEYYNEAKISRSNLAILVSPKQGTIPTCLDIMVEDELHNNVSVIRDIPNNLSTEFVKIEIPSMASRGIIYIRFITAVDIKESRPSLLNNEFAIGSYYFVDNLNPIKALGFKLKPFCGISNICVWKKALICLIESLFKEYCLNYIEIVNLARLAESEWKRNLLCRQLSTISRCNRPTICKKNKCTCVSYEQKDDCINVETDCPKPVEDMICKPKQITSITIHNSFALCALFGLILEKQDTCEKFEQCIEATLKIGVEFTAELTACILNESIKCFDEPICVDYEKLCCDLDYNKCDYQDVVKCYGESISTDCKKAIETFCPKKLQTTVCKSVTLPAPTPVRQKKCVKKVKCKTKKSEPCDSSTSSDSDSDSNQETKDEGSNYVKYAAYSVVGVVVVAVVIYSITFFV